MVTLSSSREAARAAGTPEPVGIRHLVIPLDGTPLAERAIAPAASLARALNAEITLVRAYGGSSLPSGSAVLRRLLHANGDDVHHASLYLARLQAELRSLGIRASSRVVQAQPVEAILEVAAHTPAELVVLATRGGIHDGERPIGGSVAAEVIRYGQIPVLVVNGATANPFDAGHAGGLRLAATADDVARNRMLGDYVGILARDFDAEVAMPSGSDDALGGLRGQGVRLLIAADGGPASAEPLGVFAYAQRADLVVVSGGHETPRATEDAEAVLDLLRQSRVPVLFVP
jgi:nucleotide-binding universal stress UspA family protein